MEVSSATSRLLPQDILGVGSVGLRTRKLRAGLSALGVAIGIAAMVSVVGISDSSQADLIAQLDALGTNLLTVTPGQSFVGGTVELPAYSVRKAKALAAVNQGSATYALSGETVRRNRYIDPSDTGGISVAAADLNLPETLSGRVARGQFLTPASANFPTVVLGSVAAQRLGIGPSAVGNVTLYIADQQFTVVGILESLPLAPDVDRAALIGLAEARRLTGSKPPPSTIFVRADPDEVNSVHDLLPATVDPEHPEETQVSRPSDALAARAAAKNAFTGLLLGLGAVALLVGGVGIANVMVISVLERRAEVGLRRALGATRRHITIQFLTEALVLGAIGGASGSLFGAAVIVIYAASSGVPAVIPPLAILGGLATALAVAGVAGLYPALRAARLAPTEALRTT